MDNGELIMRVIIIKVLSAGLLQRMSVISQIHRFATGLGFKFQPISTLIIILA